MRLNNGGIDIFYIDESGDRDVFAMTAVSVPFLRNIEGTWMLVWDDHYSTVRQWRQWASKEIGIPVRKELKGNKLASGRGRYKNGRDQLPRAEAAEAYRALLSSLGFLQDLSIITVTGSRESELYGHGRLEALLFALLQRMRTACYKSKRTGLVFFDEGHGEYRKLFRKAQVYLPTGSSLGGWGTGESTRNIPLDNFTKDGNTKDSRYSHYIQLADLISYAAFLKRKSEVGSLTFWQDKLGLEDLYNAIPRKVLNVYANAKDPNHGIVRL